MEAGEEIDIVLELNWARTGVTKDWSLVTWGEKGKVAIQHSSGVESQHFTYIPKGELDIDNIELERAILE